MWATVESGRRFLGTSRWMKGGGEAHAFCPKGVTEQKCGLVVFRAFALVSGLRFWRLQTVFCLAADLNYAPD